MSTSKSKRGKPRRRGIVLLMVLSLLVLFVLVGVTFVIVAGQYRTSAASMARYRRASGEASPKNLLDAAMYQLVRDTDIRSSLKFQSLLFDLYGNDGISGYVLNYTVQADGQFVELVCSVDRRNADLFNRSATSIREDYFNGRVLSIVDEVWNPGPDGGWGAAANNDDTRWDTVQGGPVTDDPLEIGVPGSDDRIVRGKIWTRGADLAWGRAGADDDGDSIVDNMTEAGYRGSDDVMSPAYDKGPDLRWGVAGIDDNGDGVPDNMLEAGWPGSDDSKVQPHSSTRIVDSGPGPAPNTFFVRVEAFPDFPLRSESFDRRGEAVPCLGRRIIINGSPFNGTGVGFHPGENSRTLDLNIPYSRGTDGEWGVAGVDDDGNGFVDMRPDPVTGVNIPDHEEAGWPGSDDIAFPVALAQNFLAHEAAIGSAVQSFNTVPDSGITDAWPWSVNQGGPDESWDVVDYQNMYLAMVPPTAASSSDVVPSFHRPALINYLFYWVTQNIFWDEANNVWFVQPNQHVNMFLHPFGPDHNPLTTGDNPPAAPAFTFAQRQAIVDVKRMCIMRPLPEDNPNFTGSNATDFVIPLDSTWTPATESYTSGAWDVDNDGDGIPDSIWIDIGLPVQRRADGRLFRPLAAIMVQDLDSRFDLNAHGNQQNRQTVLDTNGRWHPGLDARWGMAGVDDNGNGNVDEFQEAGWTGSDDRQIAGVTTASGSELPRGLGYGPSEVSLAPLFRDTSDATRHALLAAELQSLLLGKVITPTNIIPGRLSRRGSLVTVPGRTDGVDDELSLVKGHALPRDYFNTTVARSGYASPSDIFGLGSMGLDPAGHPLTTYMGITSSTVDDPYEKRVGGSTINSGTVDDALFSVSELERLLRYDDYDSRLLADRLLRLAPNAFDTTVARRMVTTLSSHIPATNVSVPREQRDEDGWGGPSIPPRPPGSFEPAFASPTLIDLLVAKLDRGLSPARINLEIRKMLSIELRNSQLFDLNRPFGNSRDDNGNGVVDEYLEAVAGEDAWTDANLPANSTFRSVAFNYHNDDPYPSGTVTTRQIFARHLYCLMMMLVDQGFVHPNVEGLTGTDGEKLTARRIAQWAVNVVDFRDPDAIMTPFEYDENPFDGWDVDGIIVDVVGPGPDGAWGVRGVDDDSNGTIDDVSERGMGAGNDDLNDNALAGRGLVWGCEYPDVLITETAALHDRRVKDTGYDTTMKKRDEPMDADKDDDPDQFRIPQGSLFLELYCTRNYPTNNPIMPAELYNAAGELDLGRLAPERTIGANSIRSPVWRAVLANRTAGTTADSNLARGYGAGIRVEDTTFEPENMSLLSELNPMSHPAVDLTTPGNKRIIWFTPHDPTNNPEANFIYYERTGSVNLSGSSTLQAASDVVIAPNGYAVIGPRATTTIGSTRQGPDMNAMTHDPSTHALSISGSSFTATDNTLPVGGAYTYPTATEIQVPQAYVCAAEPPTTWVNQTRQVGLSVSEPLPQSGDYYTEPNPTNDSRDPPDAYDNPLTPLNTLPDEPLDNDPSMTLGGDTAGVQTGTRADFSSAFLQRLADPTLPWNPVAGDANHDSTLPVNPYLTVDWSTVDLTVFSGDEDTDQQITLEDGMTMEWLDPDDPDPFGTAPAEAFTTRERNGNISNIWTTVTAPPTTTTVEGTANSDNYFRHRFEHSLGYLNTNTNIGGPTQPTTPGYQGAPGTRFPWLTWNNRPFANPGELMLVPTSSPARLLYEYAGPLGISGSPSRVPFAPDPNTNQYTDSMNRIASFRAPYGHLLNFFSAATFDRTDSSAEGDAGNFFRLFDYVETPSPFVGTERWYNSTRFSGAGSIYDGYRPPLNRLSRFRDPGRINLNTIYDDTLWDGISEFTPGLSTLASAINDTRRGYPTAGFFRESPSRFSNPFRSAASADHMPNINVKFHAPYAMPDPDVTMRKSGVEATLLRPTLSGSTPLFNFASTDTLRDTNRNPFFRYQGLGRLSNLVTTHSNVFAVWVTIGFFEVEPNPGGWDFAHPDGYRLGQELGQDTGDVRRHRAFYIIDRSIPVAFQPGENHNIDRAVLLRRFIE